MTKNKILINFLLVSLVIILFQVWVGGITRLTGSGLSMTEWKVIAGSIPPLNEQDWQDSFEKYKTIPQYKVLNPDITLSEYKKIFFWEYFHRMWGRLGFLFLFGGFFVLLLKGYLDNKWTKRFIYLLLIYLAQGLMGWLMVKSGLSDLIYVSHYRLTAHLLLAVTIFAYIAWLLSFLVEVKDHKINRSKLKIWFWLIFTLFILQLIFGGFMSGLRLSVHYPTWPLMHGKFIPDNLFFQKPFIKNFGENYATIQFVHRIIAYLITIFIMTFFFKIRKFDLGKIFTSSVYLLPVLLFLQLLLGIFTLVLSDKGTIPISLASAHQINAFLLFTNFIFIWFLLKRIKMIN